MPDKKNFNVEDAFQHAAFVPENEFKDDLRNKLHQRYQKRKGAASPKERGPLAWLNTSPEPQSVSLPGRVSLAFSGKLIPGFTVAFMLVLALALGIAVMLPSVGQSLTVATPSATVSASPSATEEGTIASSTPTDSNPTVTDQATVTPSATASLVPPPPITLSVTDSASPSPTLEPTSTPAPTQETAAPTEQIRNFIASLFIGCSETRVSGFVEVDAPYVKVGVSLASNLMESLGTTVVPVAADGSYQASLTYALQTTGTRLIVAVGEWDGSQFLRPATMQGGDCIGS